MHMVQSVPIQLGKELTREQRMAFTTDVAAPKLYKYSDAAYYSESDYNANDWKVRFVTKYYVPSLTIMLVRNQVNICPGILCLTVWHLSIRNLSLNT